MIAVTFNKVNIKRCLFHNYVFRLYYHVIPLKQLRLKLKTPTFPTFLTFLRKAVTELTTFTQ